MSGFKFEETAKEAAKNPDIREMFEALAKPFDLNKIQVGDASKAQPFISPIAWAIFQAYYAILAFSVAQIHIIKSGLGMEKPLDSEGIDALVKTAFYLTSPTI